MCVLCGSLFNLLSLGQLLTELCMPAFLTGKSQTEHSMECSAGSWKPASPALLRLSPQSKKSAEIKVQHMFIASFLAEYGRERGSSPVCFHDSAWFRSELENHSLKSFPSYSVPAHTASWHFSSSFPLRSICFKCVSWWTQDEILPVPPGHCNVFILYSPLKKTKEARHLTLMKVSFFGGQIHLVVGDYLNRAKTSQQRAFYFSWCLLLWKGNICSPLQGRHTPCKFWVGRLFKIFQSVFFTLTQYQLKEICLKFPKIEATGGVKTHPGLSDILMLLPTCAHVMVWELRLQEQRAWSWGFWFSVVTATVELLQVPLPFSSGVHGLLRLHPCSVMPAFLILAAFPSLNLLFFCETPSLASCICRWWFSNWLGAIISSMRLKQQVECGVN